MSDGLLLLDTHVWLWLASGKKSTLTPHSIRIIERAGEQSLLRVSIISIWEIAMLVSKGRIVLPLPVADWVHAALKRKELRLLSLDHPAIVIDSCNLPGNFHADPADRLLVATARSINAVLLTRDEKILAHGKDGHVRVMKV